MANKEDLVYLKLVCTIGFSDIYYSPQQMMRSILEKLQNTGFNFIRHSRNIPEIECEFDNVNVYICTYCGNGSPALYAKRNKMIKFMSATPGLGVFISMNTVDKCVRINRMNVVPAIVIEQ